MYVLDKNYFEFFPELKGITFSCESGFIDNGWLFIKESYKWDGCTYAINTKRTKTASLIHDFFYEYGPISRELADKLFYKQLKTYKFQLAFIYYIGVRLFGNNRYYNINKIYKLTKDYERFLTDLININFKCDYGYIDEGLLLIKKDYCYKSNIGNFSNKNFCNIYLIYRFLNDFKPISNKEINSLIYYLLKLDNFKFCWLYYSYIKILN